MIKDLAPQPLELSLKKHQLIPSPSGTDNSKIYAVTRGLIAFEQSRRVHERRRLIYSIAKPSQGRNLFSSEEFCPDPHIRARALTDSTLLVSDFDPEDAEALWQLFKSIAHRTRVAEDMQRFQKDGYAELRIDSALVDLSMQKGNPVRTVVPVEQSDIAALTGCARETVTRRLGTLRERGIVASEGEIEILQLRMLHERLAQSSAFIN